MLRLTNRRSKPHPGAFGRLRRYGQLLLVLLPLALFSLFLYRVVSGKVFTARDLHCSREGKPCDEQITAEIAKLQGHSLLTVNTQALSRKLKQADPSLAEAEITVILPATLDIRLTDRQPFAGIASEHSKAFLLCDQQGFIYKITDFFPESLPVLTLPRLDLSVGEKLKEPELLACLDLIKLLQSQFIAFSEIKFHSVSLVRVILTDNLEALFTIDGDLNSQVTSLQQILAQATITSTPSLIDLRYTKPVISPLRETN